MDRFPKEASRFKIIKAKKKNRKRAVVKSTSISPAGNELYKGERQGADLEKEVPLQSRRLPVRHLQEKKRS